MDEDKSEVKKLRDTLYSRTQYQAPDNKRAEVTAEEETEAPEAWESPNLDEMLKAERRKPDNNSFMKKIFVVALIFFIATIGIAAYIYFGGANFVSTKNVDIEVLGPTAVSAGDVLELGITVSNKNNAKLAVTNLSVQFPEETRSAEDTTKSLTYMREDLGELRAGGEVTKNVRAILFGEKGEILQIRVNVEYKVEDSDATFSKSKVYEISIGESPVTLEVSEPEAVTSGDPFNTKITITSVTDEVIKGLMVRAEYPYGYALSSSEPEAMGEDNVWTLGDLAPGDKKTVTLNGQLLGENEEERTFRFYVGVENTRGSEAGFKATLASISKTVKISRPALGIDVLLNGDDSSIYIAPMTKTVNASINFKNNLPERVTNPRLVVTLGGTALDKLSVNALNGGFYDSASNRISWNLVSNAGVGELLPGDSAKVGFSFASLANLQPGMRNQEITLNIVGVALGESGNPITINEKRTVRIASQVSLTSKGLFSRGPFVNKGPLPPKAEKETTYTLTLALKNTQNDVVDSKVTATLGQNVKWLGKISPTNEDVIYDEASNTVTWNVGKLASGAGFSVAGKELFFQVSLTPSLSQVGMTPTLLTNITFSGKDDFTSNSVTVTNPPISTSISSDPRYVQGDGVVVK